ncbi:ADP-ribosylation factor-related protein 1 isoform X2 [Callorhinus ursinus]|uniref:ADP-ribosylation factor-related protein 1 isoform X2 n=1 Tax=Callorhinus ursinus TaxID=34884 RepID=UPI003CCFFFF4
MYTLLSGLYKYVFQKDEYCILILGLDNAGKTTFLEQSKTRFNKNYKGMSLSKITTTVVGTVDVGKARLMFWDLGGQEELQSLWDKFCLRRTLPQALGSGTMVVCTPRAERCPDRSPACGAPCCWPAWSLALPLPLGGLCDLAAIWPPRLPSTLARDLYYAECHGVIYVIDSTDEERLSESKRAFEKMVTSEALGGVPILVLANKQDVETCLSIPDIKTAFSDCTSKIGRRDCLTQACSALTGKGVREGIEWMVKCVVRNVHRPPRQRDIT